MKSLRKPLILLVFSILFLLATATSASQNPEAFAFFQSKGWTQAKTLDAFHAEQPVTLAEWMKWVVLSNGVTQTDIQACQKAPEKKNWRWMYYLDVTMDSWYSPYVCIFHEKGWIKTQKQVIKPEETLSYARALMLIGIPFDLGYTSTDSLNRILNKVELVFPETHSLQRAFEPMTRLEAVNLLYALAIKTPETPETQPEVPITPVTPVTPVTPTIPIAPVSPATPGSTNYYTPEDKTEVKPVKPVIRTQPGTGGGGGGGSVPTYTCGNGVLEFGEACDDGNQITEACVYGIMVCPVCNAQCQIGSGVMSYCTDGRVDATNGEECDGGANCNSRCRTSSPVSACYTPKIPVDGPVHTSLIWPLSGSTTPDIMSSGFGPRQQASSGFAYDFHRGIDIPTASGTPVLAVNNGTVSTIYLEADPENPYPLGGTVIALRHDDGAGVYYSIYMHLQSVSVAEGDIITKGQTIALSGTTGPTTFEHLHFEIREGVIDSTQNPHRNPYSYLPYNNTTLQTIAITNGATIDPTNPTVQLHITSPRDELDLNKVKVKVYDRNCTELGIKEADFNARINSGTDSPESGGITLSPAQFNASSTEYALDVSLTGLTGNTEGINIVAEAEDVTGNTVYAELGL